MENFSGRKNLQIVCLASPSTTVICFLKTSSLLWQLLTSSLQIKRKQNFHFLLKDSKLNKYQSNDVLSLLSSLAGACRFAKIWSYHLSSMDDALIKGPMHLSKFFTLPTHFLVSNDCIYRISWNTKNMARSSTTLWCDLVPAEPFSQ